METIKFLDLKPYGRLATKINIAYDRVFNSSQYIGGREVEIFENEWAGYTHSKYCVGVGNGHDALALACRFYSDGFAFEEEIYVPWKTCLPTWAAVSNNFFIGNPRDQNQEFAVAVHIYGQVILPKGKHKVFIEDCAQAHGAKLNGEYAGRFGQVATWSFYPTKNLGALGDAGAITTDDKNIADYCREMRNYGTSHNAGINSRLDPLQAAFLRAKLPYLDEWNVRRKENAQTYFDNIVPGVKVHLPYTLKGDEPCWHIFAIETDDRDDLRKFLSSYGIETMVHYPEVPYPDTWHILEAEEWTRRTLSLPVAPHVNPSVCNTIAQLVNRWMGI